MTSITSRTVEAPLAHKTDNTCISSREGSRYFIRWIYCEASRYYLYSICQRKFSLPTGAVFWPIWVKCEPGQSQNNVRPHPGPLPRGEGEPFAASGCMEGPGCGSHFRASHNSAIANWKWYQTYWGLSAAAIFFKAS